MNPRKLSISMLVTSMLVVLAGCQTGGPNNISQQNTTQKMQEISSEQKLAQQIIQGGDYTQCKQLKIQGYMDGCELNILINKAISTKDQSWCMKATDSSVQLDCKNATAK